MTRKRVNLQWIVNDSTRRATYQRRCDRLKKKSGELAKLCGVKTCVVAYAGETAAGAGPSQVHPDVWPAPPEASKLLARFREMPNVASLKKNQSQEGYLANRVKKLRDRVGKLDGENRRREAALLLDESMRGQRPGLVGTTAEELDGLRDLVDKKLAEAEEKYQAAQLELQLQLQLGAGGQGLGHGGHPGQSSSQMPPQQAQAAASASTFLFGSKIDALLPPPVNDGLEPMDEDDDDFLADIPMGYVIRPEDLKLGAGSGFSDFTFPAGPSGEGTSSAAAMTPGGFPWK